MPYQPAHSSETARYSYIWARGVVNRCLEKHARVAESFIKYTGISPRIMATLLAMGRPEWPLLRTMLSQGDIWAAKQESLGIRYASEGAGCFWSIIFARKRAEWPEKMTEYIDKQLKLFND